MKRVLVICGERPLLAGVEGLLRKVDDLILMSTPLSDVTAVIKEIKRLEPEVIIVDDTLPWTNIGSLFDLLGLFSTLRVVVVSNSENKLQVFEKKETLILNSLDLISAVQGMN